MGDSNETKEVFERFIVMGVDTKQKELTHAKIEKQEYGIDFIDIVPFIPPDKIPLFMEGLKGFLFPDGLKIYDEKLNVINDPDPLDTFKCENQFCKTYAKINPIHSKDLIYHFVTTDGDSTKRYCTALIFHEKFYLKNDSNFKKKIALSKCMPKIPIVEIMKNPLILDEDTDTIYIPKAICLISREPYFYPQRQFLHYYYHNIIMGKITGFRNRIIPVPHKLINDFNALILESGIKIAEKLWDQSYNDIASSIESDITIQYKIKETHLTEFYLSYIFNFLTVPNNCNQTLGLYRWMVPSNEKPEDQIMKCHFYQRETLSPPNFSFGPLFRRNLDQINFLKIVKNVLLERFVIIFSSSPGEISCLTESILRLISPFVYITYYVPFATLHHDWLLEAPGSSAIIGYSKVYKQHIMDKIAEGDTSGRVFVDLDENTVEEVGLLNMQLPTKPKSFLIKELTKLEQEFKSNKQKSQMWDKTVLEIQRAFFNFILWIVNDFMRFFKPLEKEISLKNNTNISTAAKDSNDNNTKNLKFEIDDIFDKEAYLKIFPLEDQTFMREFIFNTMMFSYFIGQTYETVFLKVNRRKAILEFQDSLALLMKAQLALNFPYMNAHTPANNNNQILVDCGQYGNQPQTLTCGRYIELDNEKVTGPLILSQDKYFFEVLNIQEEQVSIYPALIKWIKYLKLFNLENLEGKRKKKSQESFWSRFWSDNILHFVNGEQRQLNRNQLNEQTTLYKVIDRKRFINLKSTFQNTLFTNKKNNILHSPNDTISQFPSWQIRFKTSHIFKEGEEGYESLDSNHSNYSFSEDINQNNPDNFYNNNIDNSLINLSNNYIQPFLTPHHRSIKRTPTFSHQDIHNLMQESRISQPVETYDKNMTKTVKQGMSHFVIQQTYTPKESRKSYSARASDHNIFTSISGGSGGFYQTKPKQM